MRSKTTSFVVALLFLLLAGTMVFGYLTEKDPETVPCYDKYSNEIMGVTCYDEGMGLDELIFVLLFPLIGIIIICPWLYGMDSDDEKESYY